jgi:4-amino-4-deoxy-L-arabinose transferase-like glycosyltransferase
VGFLGSAVRDGLRGGWKAREANANAWFLVTWIGFIFLFFTKAQSKLPPYILPVFPALAVLVGAWLAKIVHIDEARRLRLGLGLFSFICGLLAVALCAVVMRPGLLRIDPAQAAALKPFAFTMAGVLVFGGVAASSLAKVRGTLPALTGVFVTMAAFLAVLQFAAPHLQKPSTKELALQVRASAKPGDRVMHYHEFFHDFTFYAARAVDLVDFKGELELEEDAAARASGRFIDEAEFRRLWTEPGRIWVVARRRDVKTLFADTTFRYHLLAETAGHYLFSNQL